MAINTSVYSGKKFKLHIAIESCNMGDFEDTAGDFVTLDCENISDVNWAAGLETSSIHRSGQQMLKASDYTTTLANSFWTYDFEWVVSHEEGLQRLMQMISEDGALADGAAVVANTFAPAVYADGAGTGELASLIIENPNTNEDRLVYGAALTNLTLKMDSGTHGGRLVASGTFYTGYPPLVGADAITPSGTESNYVRTMSQMTTKSLSGTDMVMRSWELNFNYPCVRVGSKKSATLAYGTWGNAAGGQLAGTTTSDVTNYVTASSSTFVTDGVLPGMIIQNTADSPNLYGRVMQVNSETLLAIADYNTGTALYDVCPSGDEAFRIYMDGVPEGYSRSGQMTVSGNVNVKYDAKSTLVGMRFQSNYTAAIDISNAATNNDFIIDINQAHFTDFSLDTGAEEGAFVTIPFDLTAGTSENLYSITTGS